jgi:hypothetical protein
MALLSFMTSLLNFELHGEGLQRMMVERPEQNKSTIFNALSADFQFPNLKK